MAFKATRACSCYASIEVLPNRTNGLLCFSLIQQTFRFQLLFWIITLTIFHIDLLDCILGDHGVKAQGDGWLLTVALMEGTNLAATKSSGYSDPYVVFTCNGKTKTSSSFIPLSLSGMVNLYLYFFCHSSAIAEFI